MVTTPAARSANNMKVPLAFSGLDKDDIEAAIAVLESGNLTMGEQVLRFEEEMAAYLGVSHFKMVNSGSSANLLMIEALMRPSSGKPRLYPGDQILVPAIAWPTTVWPLVQLGLSPVFVDVHEKTLAIDIPQARKALETTGRGKIRGIFPIHPLGFALDPSAISALALEFDLCEISDTCESLGSWRDGLHAGAGSLMSSYSFYFSHHITTMEGGGIATNDDELNQDLISQRAHGWSRGRSDSPSGEDLGPDSLFQFITTGYNLRPMEVQAAIGRVQLRKLDHFVRRRREIAKYVGERLSSFVQTIDPIREFNIPSDAHSWMLLPIQLTGRMESRREEVMAKLWRLGIESRPVLTGNFLRQKASTLFPDWPDPASFPVAEHISQTSFLVACHQELTDTQVDFLVDTLNGLAKDG